MSLKKSNKARAEEKKKFHSLVNEIVDISEKISLQQSDRNYIISTSKEVVDKFCELINESDEDFRDRQLKSGLCNQQEDTTFAPKTKQELLQEANELIAKVDKDIADIKSSKSSNALLYTSIVVSMIFMVLVLI